jgi:hypothetical protein
MKSTYILIFAMALLVFGCKSTQTTQTGQSKYYDLSGGEGAPKLTEYKHSSEMKTDNGTLAISIDGQVLMKGKVIGQSDVSYDAKESGDTIKFYWHKYIDISETEMSGETKTESIETNLPGTETIFFKDENGLWEIQEREKYSDEDMIILMDEIEDFNSEDDEYEYPVQIKMNETHEMPKKAIKKMFKDSFGKIESGKFIFTLIDVIEKENDTIAVLDCQMSMTGSFKEDDGTVVNGEMDLSGKIYRSLIWFEDLKVEMEGTVKMSSELKEMGEAIKMTGGAPITLSWTLEPIEYNH